MTLDITILISIIGCAVAVATFFIGRTTAAKTAGKQDGTMLTEIGYIKANTDEIKAEQKEQRKTNSEYAQRLTAVEESAKSAHKRIDEIERRDK